MTMLKKKLDANQFNLKDQVVSINRVTKVVKGGKNMSFAALVVVGDPSAGVVGHGSGKAKEVPQAIRKGIEAAKKNLIHVHLTDTTIPHLVLGRYGAGQVLLKPAPEGCFGEMLAQVGPAPGRPAICFPDARTALCHRTDNADPED